MQPYKYIFPILIVFLFSSNYLFSQKSKLHQIDSLVQSYNRSGVFNGNVLVSKNKKVLYSSSFGFTDATKSQKLTTDYRFNIGSITKEFSAVALMQLQEKGKLELDDKVSKFMPELGSWANEVSIRDLLNYTSGIPNVKWKQIKNDQDLLNGLKEVDSLIFKPGTKYDYNNNNIFLRHFIVERISGMPFKTYVEKFIFKPCKMNAAIMTPLENGTNIARGFNNNLVADKADLPFTGGTYVTTIDLLNWANYLHSGKIINKKSLFEIGQHFNLEDAQSALGNATYKDQNLINHRHHGRAGSYEALLVSDITSNFTIILLTNNHNGKVSEISDAIMTILKS